MTKPIVTAPAIEQVGRDDPALIAARAVRLVSRMLDPDDLGLAVSAEIRDACRRVIGLSAVDSSDGR